MNNPSREAFEQAYAQASEHLDAEGVPEDSLYRGLVQVHLAINQTPGLGECMMGLWPNCYALMQ